MGRELWEIANAGQLKPGDVIIRIDADAPEAVIENRLIPGHVLIQTDAVFGKLKGDFKVFRRVDPADDPRVLRKAVDIMHERGNLRWGVEEWIEIAREELESEEQK